MLTVLKRFYLELWKGNPAVTRFYTEPFRAFPEVNGVGKFGFVSYTREEKTCFNTRAPSLFYHGHSFKDSDSERLPGRKLPFESKEALTIQRTLVERVQESLCYYTCRHQKQSIFYFQVNLSSIITHLSSFLSSPCVTPGLYLLLTKCTHDGRRERLELVYHHLCSLTLCICAAIPTWTAGAV